MNTKSDNQRICKYLEFKQQTNRQPKLKKIKKSAGCDGIAVEVIKNAPKTIDQKNCKYIQQHIRNSRRTRKLPQTPIKIKGLPSNLPLMTLLSTIRKILAVFILSRIKARVNNKMPSTILTL